MTIPICICQAGHCDDACEVCKGVSCPYAEEPKMTTTEERYKAAVAAIKAGGVTVRVNVRSCCRGCVEPEQLGTTADMASNDPHAWTFGGQGDALKWRDGEAYSGESYQRYLRNANGRPWRVTPEGLAKHRAKAVHWYHGGPGVEAAQKVADAFRAQGFEVGWDGDEERSVTVFLPACDCMTEPNPHEPEGPELVLTHSTTCVLHPEYDGALA